MYVNVTLVANDLWKLIAIKQKSHRMIKVSKRLILRESSTLIFTFVSLANIVSKVLIILLDNNIRMAVNVIVKRKSDGN